MNNLYEILPSDYLMHHGILGQKWGKRNGGPYPLSPSAHSAAEKKHMSFKEKKAEKAKNTPKGYAESLTDEELKIQNDRMRAEIIFIDQYNKLHPTEKTFSQKVFESFRDSAAQKLGQTASTAALNIGIAAASKAIGTDLTKYTSGTYSIDDEAAKKKKAEEEKKKAEEEKKKAEEKKDNS